jgi:hypothetical protein
MNSFKKYVELNEASYAGNIGIMELIKFKQKASAEQKKQFDKHVADKKHKEAWKLVQDVTGVKLHKSVSEAQEFVSKAGAGEYGRPESLINYQKGTPGQSVGTLPQQRKKSN